ncbi:MAG: hypothetical protein DMD33_18225 [Gemmatimonadetes bacterium]|nr:MAG: hypothetical protein DMD33_18225 [Gemmatimonadota bacterium]
MKDARVQASAQLVGDKNYRVANRTANGQVLGRSDWRACEKLPSKMRIIDFDSPKPKVSPNLMVVNRWTEVLAILVRPEPGVAHDCQKQQCFLLNWVLVCVKVGEQR